SKEVAFFAILLFICAPFHTASLYWISAQMSLFSLLFISIAMYFSIKYSIFYSTFLSYLFAFISILVYENSIALMPLIVLVILFSKESFYKKVIYVLPYPLGLFSYLLFKRTALVFINATEFVKEASLIRSDSLKLMLEQITLFSNFFFGPDALKFVSDILRNYRDLIVLEYFSSVLLLLVAFLYLLYTLYVYVRKKYHSSKYLCDVPPISRWILYFSFILSFFVPVIGNYSTSSAPMGDRINLPHLLLLATLGSAIILDKARVLGLKVIFLFLLFFTIMNNISLAHYIRASELQLEFAEFIKHTEISENTLINLSTDIRTYKGIPVLDNIWTRTYIISNYKNLYNVETDIDYDRFSTDGSTIKYQSILSPTRFFSDPAIIDITYFRNQ
ncbi:MAG TPA: hypothetical protein PLF29_01385, partial [bacterium]|nr:hypothetical protein [bacterium]